MNPADLNDTMKSGENSAENTSDPTAPIAAA